MLYVATFFLALAATVHKLRPENRPVSLCFPKEEDNYTAQKRLKILVEFLDQNWEVLLGRYNVPG